MIRRSVLIASVVAAMSFVGTSAHAAFTIMVTVTNNSPAGLNLNFGVNPLIGAPTPTPTGGISYNFLNVNYNGSTFTGSSSDPNASPITVSGTLTVNNGGVTGVANYTEVLSYNVVGGYGNLGVVSSFVTPGSIAGVTFAPLVFSSPTLADGTASTGSLSTTVMSSAVAVPEPTSMAMLGLGLAGVGFVAKRRRAA